MSRDLLTPAEFFQKCEWEGGRLYEGFEYGLRAKDLDDSNPKFKALIQKFEDLYLDFEAQLNEIEDECVELIDYEMMKFI